MPDNKNVEPSGTVQMPTERALDSLGLGGRNAFIPPKAIITIRIQKGEDDRIMALKKLISDSITDIADASFTLVMND